MENSIERSEVGTSVLEVLKRQAEDRPRQPAIVSELGEFLNFEEVYLKSKMISEKLKKMGIGEGDLVFLMVRPSIEFYLLSMAIWNIGGILFFADENQSCFC